MSATSALIGAGVSAGFSPIAVLAANRTTYRPPQRSIGDGACALAWMLGAGFLGGQHLGVIGAISLLPLLTLGTAAALVDVRERRLPDRLTGALALVTAAAIGIAATVEPAVGVRAVIGAAAGLVLATLGRICGPEAFGWGDAKLLPSLTAWLAASGLDVLITGLLAGCGLIAVTALVVAARYGRSALVPFGPALIIGTIIPIATTGFA